MARTVTVGLRAEVGQYKRGMAEAERATEKLADAIDDVDGKNFDEAAVSAKKLGGATAAAGGEASKAARQLDEMAKHAAKLDGQIRDTEESIRSLAKGFAGTGDAKILTSIREQQKALSELRGVRKLLPDPAAAARAGEEVAAKIGAGFESKSRSVLPDGIRKALQSASPSALGAAGLGAALAPTVGALVAAAVVGGVGIGGIAGGIALAAKSPAIAARAQDLGKTLLGGLQLQASQALTGPLMGAFDDLDALASRTIPKIGAIFAAIAPSVERLTASLGSGADGLVDGLVVAAQKSGPVLDAIGRLVENTGKSVGGLFASMAEHSDAAAAAFDDVDTAIQDVVTVAGGLLEVLFTIRELEDGLDHLAEKGGLVGATFKSLKWEMYGPLGPMAQIITSFRDMGNSSEKAEHQIRSATAAAGAAGTAAENLAATADDVKEAQDKATFAQSEYTRSLENLNPAGTRAKQVADGITAAMQTLYGAQMQAADANESYEASWDSLSDSVKENKRSLDIHTASGRANRDALKGLLTSSRDLYVADINSGKSTEQAAKKHRDRTAAIKDEAAKLGLDKKMTRELIDTYGQIPPKKTTDLVVQGVNDVAKQLKELSVIQYALAKGIPIASARAAIGGEKGPAKRGGGYATGGRFDGQLPGPPSAVDNLTGVGPAGQVFGLAGGEYIVNAKQTAKYLPELQAINAGADGYAAGGYFPSMDTSTRWPFPVTAAKTKIMSEAQARAKVTPGVPGGGKTSDWIIQVVHAAFPGMQVLSKDRPGAVTLSGNKSYHSMGRAVDWPASKPLAEWINANYFAKTRELITPWNSLNIHNGQRHTYTGDVYAQHAGTGKFKGNAHDHWAMANGGVIPEYVVGVGLNSGRTYSFGERGPERVTPMRGYAGGGLVNVAPKAPATPVTPAATGFTPTGTRLDYIEATLAARDAVAQLSAALKENGKSWSISTAKGRDNRQSLIAGIRAAQAAAVAKYNETGSVRAANKVYSDYLKQLDASLKKMGVNAKQRKALIKAYSEKPDYNLPDAPAPAPAAPKAPSNSSAVVRSVTDQMAVQEQLAATKQAFAWTKPNFTTTTEAGRTELTQLFSFLSAAQAAAQSMYDRTGNAKMATALYNSYISQLRTILARSGMSRKSIDTTLQRFAKITLEQPTTNRAGGIYEHAASGTLREAHLASGHRTLYAYSEPGTGGELFAPRFGPMEKTRRNVTKAVTQWWGGRDPWGSAGSSRPITVQATIPITLGSEVITRQVRLEVDAAVGRVVSATVYQTA